MVSVFYVLTRSSQHHLSPTVKSYSGDASNHCGGSNEASATTVCSKFFAPVSFSIQELHEVVTTLTHFIDEEIKGQRVYQL